MPAAVRSYVATGLALMGTGIVAAAEITPPIQQAQNRVIEAAVSLVAAVGNGQACSGYNTEGCDIFAKPTYTPVAADPSGSLANLPANLFNAVVSMPRAFIDGLNELSYALEVTGNWWVYSPTNVLGFDPADPPKITALADLLIPFKPLSNAVGDQFAWWARANLPMEASCTGTVGPACSDIAPILNSMFLAPIWTLAAGYQFPELYNPVSDAEGALGEEIPGQSGPLVPWSGEYVKLNPSDWITSVTNYLLADPATNAPKPITLPEIGATLDRFVKALVIAFNPFVPKSYLLKGWPYTALTPLFLPFVPILCKECDPNNPGGPALPSAASAAAEPAPAVLVSAPAGEAPAAVDVSEPPVAGDVVAGLGNDKPLTGSDKPLTGAGHRAEASASDTAVAAAPQAVPAVAETGTATEVSEPPAVEQAPVVEQAPAVEADTVTNAVKDAISIPDTAVANSSGPSVPSSPFHTPRRGRSISSLEVLPGSANVTVGHATTQAGGADSTASAPRARAGAADTN